MGKAVSIYVSGNACFMRHPCSVSGHWIKTGRCVAFVACPYCGSVRGELCKGTTGYISGTHILRRQDYLKRKKDLDPDRGSEKLSIIVEERHG